MDDSTAPTLLNMIAFKMRLDFKRNYEFSEYVWSMDSLIDNLDDVKELRKARVLHNMLGSDEEVAKLFNTISTGLVFFGEKYQEIREQIEHHYTSKKRTWMVEARFNYFSNPWYFIAFLATFTTIILTLIQTLFAAFLSRNA